jgi:exodeoxyribonuclease V beta subunit
MRGFIDLVFRHQERYYIADWKSNYLGPRVADYSPGKLRQVMRDEDYALQYLIYTVALHRYLALRLPEYDYERHFGGVFYLFVRGIEARSGDRYGVYRARPERNLIQELSDKLMGQGDQHCR